jgi:hypothetical protein
MNRNDVASRMINVRRINMISVVEMMTDEARRMWNMMASRRCACEDVVAGDINRGVLISGRGNERSGINSFYVLLKGC